MNDEFQTEDAFPAFETMVITPNPQTSVNVVDKDGNVSDASAVTVPSSRNFRDAWCLDGDAIAIDMTAAKTIFADAVREARKEKFDALDADFMRALETDADTSQIVLDKQALRDAPAAGNSAENVTDLEAAWPSICGDSPFIEKSYEK